MSANQDELLKLCYDIIDTDSDEELVALIRKTYIKNMIVVEVVPEAPLLFNADGSVRKVNRSDYSRGPKDKKVGVPWETCKIYGSSEIRA